MAKSSPVSQFDVFAIGDHSSAYLAAAAVKAKQPKLVVGHAVLPGESHPDRLTIANPKLFDLHPILSGLKKQFSNCCTCGAQFLSETPNVRGEYASKTPTAIVLSTRAFTAAAAKLAGAAGVIARLAKAQVEIRKVIDDGVEISIDDKTIAARVLLVATPLPQGSARTVGLTTALDANVTHHYRFATFKPAKGMFPSNKPLVMSLDLAGTGAWAWLLPCGDTAQVSVMQLARKPALPPGRDLDTWIENLIAHAVLPEGKPPKLGEATTIDLPVAGALSGETVANRTLLVGPAGGFISACSEELYPGCWSAILAADVAVASLKERHVQDSLINYREQWGSTVGDYLRGPQQNLKLLLPLIYRNAIMAARVGEAIFLGESVVR